MNIRYGLYMYYLCFLRFLGTSGQSIDDIYRFAGYDDRMEILKHTLFACHLAPTAPDTLGDSIETWAILSYIQDSRLLSLSQRGSLSYRGMSRCLLCWKSARFQIRDYFR